MDELTDIIFSILFGIIIVFLVWLSLKPKYIIIKNKNNNN